MTIKKSRRHRFTHSLDGEIQTKEQGDTMIVTTKDSSKKTKESMGAKLRRFEQRIQRR
jgi:hypothetical protein